MIERYNKFISNTFLSLGCVFFSILVIMTFIQVITRYVVNISFPWAEEFCDFVIHG